LDVAGQASSITTAEASDVRLLTGMLVTSVAVLGLLPLALRCYAHARYPGKEALWLRVKTTHSTSYVPFRYLQADVRSKMVTELAANRRGSGRVDVRRVGVVCESRRSSSEGVKLKVGPRIMSEKKV
tara:strand:- start:1123 stop:1503 length:381 start_codon:yes stop_codon:yes gene_type:complete